ncbi:RNA-binding protein [Helicobacter didelphidarum]|uniref:RNA-binding protein n=1 Tax=Helicobacter didelphidarum TaxID=2040648 RepID=A0A3D8INV7_9HELI|nr:RNA-binding protein [Helicobacter didelphidarum]RDU66967.1 RNA-binding protein [Helicobacter didelphidarum]
MKSIYVGNLPYRATQEEIRDLFAQFGEVLSSVMINDKVTKKFKGYAFIEMEDENANTAIATLNGETFLGRILKVNEANQKP